MAINSQEQPKEYRWLHVASTLAYLVYAVLLIVRIGSVFAAADSATMVALLVLSPVVGYLLADFMSGFVHFLGDTVGDENTPIVGKAFIYAFREHHHDQKAITRHDFFYTNGNNCLVSLPIMLLMYHIVPLVLLTNPLIAFLFSSLFFLVIGIFFTNQIHKWSHQDRPNRIARFLQRHGLILTPARHKLHHTAPHNSHYCITTGWLNPMLERFHFFPAAKFVLARVPFIPKVK